MTGTTVIQGQIDRSNSERADAAAAAAGVSITHHSGGKKKTSRNVDPQGMMDQFVLNVGSVDQELLEAIKAATAVPSGAVKSPESKRSRKSTNLSNEINKLMNERSMETDPTEIAKLTKKIARKRKQRDEIDGDSEEEDE